MHSRSTGVRAVAVLLLISLLFAQVLFAQGLPKGFPVNAIPIPGGSGIEDRSDTSDDLNVQIEKSISGKDMVKFYHDALSNTVPGLHEAAGKEGVYWFWGEFDSGKAAFSVTVVNANNTEPERIQTAVMIRVLLKGKGELPEFWKQRKEIMFRHVQGAIA